MRWVSSKESARNGDPSVLAIVETLVAMGLSLWIAVHFGTVKHIIIGGCIAPLLLLRTDESCLFGHRAYDGISRRLRFIGQAYPGNLLYKFLVFLAFAFFFVPIRVFTTAISMVRKPLESLRAIPWNWRRASLTTDFGTSPQPLPDPDDIERLREAGIESESFYIYDLIGVPLSTTNKKYQSILRFRAISSTIVLLVILPFFLIVGVPPLLYRLSLKSTAIIWFPLLWALRPVGPIDKPLKLRLSLFERSDLLRIILLVSAAALLLFAGKLILWNELAQASNTWNESIGGRILAIHVAPGVVEWWQGATAINSVIAIGLWLYVRSWLRHDEAGVPQREGVVEPLLAWGLFVRRLLTSYTILCLGYMYLREAATWQLPPLGGKPFPWM